MQKEKINRASRFPLYFIYDSFLHISICFKRKLKANRVFYIILVLFLLYLLFRRSTLSDREDTNAQKFSNILTNPNGENVKILAHADDAHKIIQNKNIDQPESLSDLKTDGVQEFKNGKANSGRSHSKQDLKELKLQGGEFKQDGGESEDDIETFMQNDVINNDNAGESEGNDDKLHSKINQNPQAVLIPNQDGGLKSKPIVNPHNYQLLLNNDRICGKGDQVWLFIAVLSSADHFEARNAIRRTWGSGQSLAPLRARLAFFLAAPQQALVQRQIESEAETYGDIIQEDFRDTYLNLTLKSVMALKWAQSHCVQAQYFMKTDDDIYVNAPKLMAFLRELSRTRDDYIVGCIKQKKSFAPVHLPNDFPMPPAHPLFTAGAGYVLTGSLVPLMYRASLHVPLVPVEDVYVTGHLARAVGVHPPLHHRAFSCGELLPDDCDVMQVFTGHKITPQRMLEIWAKINPQEYNNSPCFDF
ncbi:beta-1,3-galactosyltransferase 1 [Hyalella azteca]|uniref:Hexosyltransferase n=1 Tax=Hyalella azteca TaxID=294128 RepID=A0A8B7NZE2_HYAAZ|nr:beta-1,3-galactosyltransferase 1 [Hyalella azteca]